MSFKSTAIALPFIMLLAGCQSLETKQVGVAQTELTIVGSQDTDSDGDGVKDVLDQCPNTASNMVVDPNGCPISLLPDENSFKMEARVFFDEGSSEISGQYLEDLDKAGARLQKRDDAMMFIYGHISEPEDILANQSLAQTRADAVKNYLILKYNIDPKRINICARGSGYPIADDNNIEERRYNRRVYAVTTNDDYIFENYHCQ